MTLPNLDMPTLLAVSTAVDLLAVAVLAWLVRRAGRGRDAALEARKKALESLRTGLANLVADAEQRAERLEEALGAREKTLRALLTKLERAEAAARTSSAPRAPSGTHLADRAGLPALARRLGMKGKRATTGQPTDPAEARLLHDLEVAIGSAK